MGREHFGSVASFSCIKQGITMALCQAEGKTCLVKIQLQRWSKLLREYCSKCLMIGWVIPLGPGVVR